MKGTGAFILLSIYFPSTPDSPDITITAVSAVTTPQPPAVSHDLPCTTCAYNLRTIAESGRCPECGVTVAHTRHDYTNRLAASDPYFQRAVRSGLDCIALAILCPVASALFLRYPNYTLGNWLTGTRQQLAISLAPAIMAIAGSGT